MNQAMILGLLVVAQLDPLTHTGSLTNDLRSPARVAVAPDGTVLVSDPFNNRIARFDGAGTPLGVWAVPEGPVGVAAHPDGRFLVSLRDEPKVAIYDASFTLTGYLDDSDPGVTFERPTDIAVASTGEIYVVDAEGNDYYVFDSAGHFSMRVGTRGNDPGQFIYPSAIAVDEPRGLVFVADHDNFRVQVFTTGGVFVQHFGARMHYPASGQEGWVPRPQGLAVDSAGNSYVTDGLMSTVRVFDPTGLDLGKVVEYGYDPGDLRIACDVALSNDGTSLYVVSTNTSSVEVYATPTLPPSPVAPGDLGSRTAASNWCSYDAWYRGELSLKELVADGQASVETGGVSGVRPWLVPETADIERLVMLLRGGGARSTWDGPHVIESIDICGRCHGINKQPGTHPGTVEGQGVLCMSCHTAGGQALELPMHELDVADPYGTNPNAADGRGRSHAWGVSAVHASADSVGPASGSMMEWYLYGGEIKCATCHNAHNSDEDAPYLRVSNEGDAMCKECHAPRNEGLGERGTHPVGFVYPGGTGEFPDASSAGVPPLKDGNVECLTCHAPHFADSGGANDGQGDGTLLRGANDGTFCRGCHAEHPNHLTGATWQPSCPDCHDAHDPASENLSLVGRQVNGTGMTFQDNDLGSNGLSDFIHSNHDPISYDGICEVCHTETNYHRNTADGNHGHYASSLCTDCHTHAEGFMPTGGACDACHGQPPDGTAWPNTAGSHAAHMTAENGPGITDCFVCHATLGGTHINGIPSFASGVDANTNGDIELSETDVCDACHSPDGPFDGVNDPAIGAVPNWADGVYDGGDLAAGKGQWCAGCHDNGTSVVDGVSAPPVAGDNSTWGYYATGHGRNGIVPCSNCHDPTVAHTDGNADTYSAAADNYQAAFRLKDVNGGPPLVVPRDGFDSDDAYTDPPYWELCFSCHDKYALLGGPTAPAGPYNSAEFKTNFRNDASVIIPDGLDTDIAGYSTGGAVDANSHYTHTEGPPEFYDSDRDGSVDSYGTCVACHNVHGSTSPVMVRDGKLIDEEPGLNFSYVRYDRHDPPQGGGCPDPIVMTSAGDVHVADSHGGVMRADGGPAANGVCNFCHGGGANTGNPEYHVNCYDPDHVDYYREPVEVGTCTLCHGWPPDGTSFPNTAGAHAVHMSEPNGPGITDCFDCHAPIGATHVNGLASFASGVDANTNGNIDLDETDVCDGCHSPDGPFDGSAEGKGNWAGGTAVSCEGCHDAGTSVVKGVSAPPVAGDNVTWGYYASGHGRNGIVPCTECHDENSTHFDGEARTYSFSTSYYGPDDSGVAYAAGYRLRYVGGEVPLMIPANYNITFGYNAALMRDTAFRLCFDCHDPGTVLDDTPGNGLDTNFKATQPNPPRNYSYSWGNGADVNEHVAHIMNYVMATWDSDWDESTTGVGPGDWDSLNACSACHNVHGAAGIEGSTNEAMIRDGTLAGRPGGYGFSYVVEDTGAGGYPMVTSTGATASNSVGSIFRYNTEINSMCGGSSCHDNPAPPTGSSYNATGYSWGTYLEYYRPWQNRVGCTTCHDKAADNGDGVPPGGRRAVIGEFPAGDAHAHYGAQVDDDDCLVCHSVATHTDGHVELVDPDDGSIYRFVQPADLTSDPDLSDFCAGCHDADGATNLPAPLDPFGGGNVPPDVASKFLGTLQWYEEYEDTCFPGPYGTQRAVNSHHDISDADQSFSGAGIECLACHGAHTSSASQPINNPFSTLVPWSSDDNSFCLACHAGGAGPTDPGLPPGVTGPTIATRGIDSCNYQEANWNVYYDWTHSAHGLTSKRGWNGYSGGPDYVLACMDCHDPHGSYTPTNTAGNPYLIRDVVDGTAYIDDGCRYTSYTGPPWNTYGTARAVVVDIGPSDVGWGGSDGLCAVCHVEWLNTFGSDWFHDLCYSCQTCHGHGRSWGEHDFQDDDDNEPCAPPPGPPPPLRDGVLPMDPRNLRAADWVEVKQGAIERVRAAQDEGGAQ